jgi:hypothetical protein
LGELLAGMAKGDAQSAKGDVQPPLVTRAANEIADRLVANGATSELMDALITRVAARVRTADLADQLANALGDEIAAALPTVLAERLRLQDADPAGGMSR